MSEGPRIVVDGSVLRAGTALFDKRSDTVLWIVDVEEQAVVLETLSDEVRLPKDRFARDVLNGDVVVEAGPFGSVESSA